MAEKVNFIKLADSLTAKEKAKMLALDLDTKLMTGNGTMNDEEVSKMMTFDKTRELAEYDFLMDLRVFGMLYIVNNIEISVLKFSMGFQIINNRDREIFTKEDIANLQMPLQSHYNTAYSLKELAKRMTEEFDFPVLGEPNENSIKEKLDYLEVIKGAVNNIILAEFLRQHKEKEEILDPPDFIQEATFDNEMIDGLLDTFVKLRQRFL